MEIAFEDVADFARGAAFLGAGGGGDPYIGRLMLEEAIRKTGPIRLLRLADVPDEAWFVTVAMMGAPSVMVEKLPNGAEGEVALRAVEKAIGASMYGIMAPEIGGINALLPLVLAARLGLPVIDADGMGRAFPELQMITFDIFGQSATPLAICDEAGNCVTISAANNVMAERLARQTIVSMGSTAQICSYPMQGKAAKNSGIPGTLTVALQIGRTIRQAREGGTSPIVALLKDLPATGYYQHCKVLHEGKVVALNREVRSGFTVGIATLDASDGKSPMGIEFRNESLVARRDGKTVAIVPDLIVILDGETAEPITVEALKYGQRVSVLGLSAPPVLRTERALKVVGPRCFGLDEDFQPLESIVT